MVIVFFLLLAFALIYVLGYEVYKFFTAPGAVARNESAIGSMQNEGQFFDGADDYYATDGYQNSREN